MKIYTSHKMIITQKLWAKLGLIFSLFLFFSAIVFSQQNDSKLQATAPIKISLNVTNEKIGAILDIIAKQTKLEFAYSAQFVDVNRRISLNVKESPLSEVLKEMFKGLDLKSNIKHGIVFIVPNEVEVKNSDALTLDNSILNTQPKQKPLKEIPKVVKAPASVAKVEPKSSGISPEVDMKISCLPVDVEGEKRFSYDAMRKDGKWVSAKGILIITKQLITLYDSLDTRKCYKLSVSEKRRNITTLALDRYMISDRCMTERIDVLSDRDQYMFKMNYETDADDYFFSLNIWNCPLLFTVRVKPIK